jgi:hypothetical protein
VVNGRIEVREAEIPPEVKALAEEKRRILIGALADVDDVIADRFLMEEEPTVEELQVLPIPFDLMVGCNPSGYSSTQILACIDGIRPR